MGKYGIGKPGVHDTGPVVSEAGFRVGDKLSSTEVIDSDGLFNSEKLAQSLDDYYIVETLANYDVMTGGSVDATASATTTLIDAGSENYEVVILVRITTAIVALDTIQFGYVGELDEFGTLSVSALDATQVFSGESDGGANIVITCDGEPSAGAFDYIILAKELEE